MTAELALLADALVKATPLIITGLAVAVAFRGGVFNIGAEGQFLVGAAAATAIILAMNGRPGAPAILIGTIGASVAGASWAWLAAELKYRFRVLEIISTIMLNFIAIHLVSYLVRGPLQEPTHIYPQTRILPSAARLPVILPETRLHLGFAIAVLLACIFAWLLRRSAVGFRIRAVGASPSAASSAGRIDVRRTSMLTFMVSGALAGIAGSVQVCGVTYALYENISPGYGYTAIAVALIAGLNPLGVIGAGVFFGFLETGATALQREFAVSSSLASVVEAAFILVVLAISAMRGKSIFQKVHV